MEEWKMEGWKNERVEDGRVEDGRVEIVMEIILFISKEILDYKHETK